MLLDLRWVGLGGDRFLELRDGGYLFGSCGGEL